mmetsp:Transcript_3916/g.11729  ORF Transcript_3916/g.11729 Transcript_3916/m.11729 type:complete len:173 (+) Transcript_3916:975-1493(+)
MVLASEHARDIPWVHWVLSPARLPSLLSIAPGTVRGRWVKPAFEQADLGRAIEIAHGAVTVGGVRRRVDWEGEVPGDLAGTIHTVTSECDVSGVSSSRAMLSQGTDGVARRGPAHVPLRRRRGRPDEAGRPTLCARFRRIPRRRLRRVPERARERRGCALHRRVGRVRQHVA